MKLHHIHFKSIDSTNTWAKHNAHTFERDKLTLITASEQTSGRGRFKRTWISPSNLNIYATFCFFLEKYRPDTANIPQVLALSISEVLEKLNFKPSLKWPNDVLLSEKKVAGILCETSYFANSLCMIVGVGLNVNMPYEMTSQIDRPATSMMIESGITFEIDSVLDKIQNQFTLHLKLFLDEGFYPFLIPYQERLPNNPQKKLSFHDNLKVWEGYFHSINPDGSLNLRLENGDVKRFIAGEFV